MKFLFETELVLDLDLICAAGQSWYSKGRRRRRKLYSLSNVDKKIMLTSAFYLVSYPCLISFLWNIRTKYKIGKHRQNSTAWPLGPILATPEIEARVRTNPKGG